jgi:diguanylate cyclase (GGDEF)-like protein/PAS domain S-box-containing protein
MVSINDIAAWRTRIFSSLLSVVLALGTIAAIPSIPMLIHQGLWPVAVMDTVALAWIFAIWRLESLPYRLRVLHFLAVLYAVAIALMLGIGPASLNYLLGPPVLAVILLGTRPAMFALALSAASIMGLGGGGLVKLAVPGMENNPLQAALAVTLNFSCVGAMLALTSGTMLKGLSQTLESVRAKTDRLRTLNDELQLTSAAVARLNDMVVIARAAAPGSDQPIIFANDAFLQRTGYTRGEIIGRSMQVLRGPDTDPATLEGILEAMANNRPARAELVNYTKDGQPYWVEMEMMPFAADGELASHWVAVGRDVTERRNAADAIHRLAFYDVLTGLPNRRMLMERLEAMVTRARAGQGLGAVLYVDLDNFKTVNDARGHATGDALLVSAAARLSRAVRQRDIVARIGGDEFVVLLDGLDADGAAATRAAQAVADKIRVALAEPFEIDGQSYHASASIGVALPLHDEGDAQDLLREADTAMYRAKAKGRNNVALFETAMLADAQRKLSLERDLALALDNGELAMHLQLQVDHDARPAGAELLMRWQRADGAFVPPDVFIPVAESSGLIIPLGRWVLREACRAWLALEAAGHALPLSINVSPLQFRQPDFVAQVRAVLRETGTPPGQLIFEVTEGLLVTDVGQTVGRMRELAALGIRFSIDDFGTGYSNLAYLKKMPLYELKIDKSFMRDTPHDANGTAIVQSILAMAGHLGLRVVAEGIECDAQARFLAEHGGAAMQGYLFHRPMPLAQLIERLDATPALAA